MKRIGMGIVGAGFVGPHHVDAVRRLGFVDVVAVAGSSEASAKAKAEALGRREGLRQLRGAARRSGRPGRAQRHAQLPALPGQRRGDRQGQARRLRQAAGDDGGRGEEAPRRRQQGRHRPRGHVQLSRQPAGPAGAARDRARRHRQAALPRRSVPAGLAAQGHRLLVAARARQGRRVVCARRHRIALVRPGAAHQRPADHRGARRHHHRHSQAQEAARLARSVPAGRRRRAGRSRRHQGRRPRVGAAAFRQRRQGQLLGRPGVRRATRTI